MLRVRAAVCNLRLDDAQQVSEEQVDEAAVRAESGVFG